MYYDRGRHTEQGWGRASSWLQINSCTYGDVSRSGRFGTTAAMYNTPVCRTMSIIFWMFGQGWFWTTPMWEFEFLHQTPWAPRLLIRNVFITTLSTIPATYFITNFFSNIKIQICSRINKTRCSAIAERPRCRVRYSFRRK